MLACFLRWASLLSAAAGLIAGASLQHAKAAGEPSTPPLDARIGWVDSCLAIQNDSLQPGTPVTVMLFDTDERLVAQRVLTRRVGAKILAKTTSAAKCPALIEDRRVSNQIAGVSFYTVSLDGAPAARPSYGIFGIGVVGVRPTDQIDLDGNGAAESFTVCKSFEALNFAVWKGLPGEGVPLWAGQYYTGQQDEEKDCVRVLEQEATEPAQSPFAAQIGWIDECLAIKNGTLAPGTPVTVLMFDGNENSTGERILKRRAAGKILGKTRSAQKCPALNESSVNEADGVSFYTLALEKGAAPANSDLGIFGIGVVGPEATKAGRIDLDGNGGTDSFTVCQSFEGIHFTAWRGEPHDDRPLWEAYDYLGYDTEGDDCPLSFSGSRPAGPPKLWSPIARVGWVHGGCVGIYNTILQPGTPVTIATFDRDDESASGRSILDRRVAGTILGRTDSGANCPDLADAVRDWNTRSDIGYYRLALNDGGSLGPDAFGIAVVGPASAAAAIDLDENGKPDSFSICGTGDSIGYVVWPGEPNAGERLWMEYSSPATMPKGVVNCPQ
jgi:hypothetical protein